MEKLVKQSVGSFEEINHSEFYYITPIWTLIDLDQQNFNLLLSHLSLMYNLKSTKKCKLIPIGINYIHLEVDENDSNLNIRLKSLDLYCIMGPLPKTNTQTYLLKLLTLIPIENSHLIYCLNVNSTWNDISISFQSKRNISKDYLLNLLKNTFIPITKFNWKSSNIILFNTQIWNYNSLNMTNVDFIQQILRSISLSNGTTIGSSNNNNNNKIIYIPNELDLITQQQSHIMSLFNSLLSTSSSSINGTYISKYCDLQIDSKFDSMDKIKLLDESFNWEGHWKLLWDTPPTVEMDIINEKKNSKNDYNNDDINNNNNNFNINDNNIPFKQYFQIKLNHLNTK